MFVAVRAKGFVTRYFWDLAPRVGAELDLGPVELEAGASMVGEVDLRSDGVRHQMVRLRLAPVIGPASDAATANAMRKDSQEVRITEHGFFQVTGLRPGFYVLEVRHPSFARSELGPIEVLPGAETRLRDAVRLLPPVDLTLGIEPVSSPSGRPWQVRVFRERAASAGSAPVFAGSAAGGILELPGQSPGLFRIVLEDEEGNRYASVSAEIEPDDGGFVAVSVPIVRVRGELRLGSKPLAGTLRFGGAHGAVRTSMTADAEGSFSGALSGGGEWRVDVESTDPPLRTSRRVEVVAGAHGTAELRIELQDTELVGRVVSPDGQPIQDARVKVDTWSEAVSSRARSDAAGEFRFRALPPGAAMIAATAAIEGLRAASPMISVTLREDVTAGPIELVVRPMHSFEGRVTSTSGPVRGARLHVVTLDRSIPSWGSAVTDLEGRFAFELPEEEGLAAFTLLPPGGFLTTAVERLRSPLELRAESAGGTVQLSLPAGAPGHAVMLQHDGVYVDPGLLAEWARGHGHSTQFPVPGELASFPRLAAGVYRLCAVAEPERRRRLQDGDNWQQIFDGARCATGSLAPGGTLELSLAEERAAE
jgi:hypothetical protein